MEVLTELLLLIIKKQHSKGKIFHVNVGYTLNSLLPYLLPIITQQ